MIHVLCSKWGDKYGPEYANRLKTMVKRHLPTKHKFYCQTENTHGLDSDIEVLPFLTDLPESTARNVCI